MKYQGKIQDPLDLVTKQYVDNRSGVKSVNGNTGDVTVTDTTYESKTAASGGTDVSLVTTGEKYIWNNKGSYSKPSGGIPASDLSSDVQAGLTKEIYWCTTSGQNATTYRDVQNAILDGKLPCLKDDSGRIYVSSGKYNTNADYAFFWLYYDAADRLALLLYNLHDDNTWERTGCDLIYDDNLSDFLVSNITSSASTTRPPTAKAVYDAIQAIPGGGGVLWCGDKYPNITFSDMWDAATNGKLVIYEWTDDFYRLYFLTNHYSYGGVNTLELTCLPFISNGGIEVLTIKANGTLSFTLRRLALYSGNGSPSSTGLHANSIDELYRDTSTNKLYVCTSTSTSPWTSTWAEIGGSSDIYWCTTSGANATTYAQVTDAFAAGKLPCVYYQLNGRQQVYVCNGAWDEGTPISFTCWDYDSDEGLFFNYIILYSNNSWSTRNEERFLTITSFDGYRDQSLSASSSQYHYPSSKCVYDFVTDAIGGAIGGSY